MEKLYIYCWILTLVLIATFLYRSIFKVLQEDAVVQEKLKTITDGVVVTLKYTLFDNKLNIIDAKHSEEAFEYTHGAGQILAGLEKRLKGLKKGRVKQIVVPVKEAYGEVNQSDIIEVDKKTVPEKAAKVGAMLKEIGEGKKTGKILEVRENTLIIDYNHPLAGKKLIFQVEVVDVGEPGDKVEEPEPEEIIDEELEEEIEEPEEEKVPTVVNNAIVKLEYTASDEDGNVSDEKKDDNAITFVYGKGEIFPGIEKNILGFEVGATANFTVPSEEAFGKVDPKKFMEIGKDEIFTDTLQVGTVLKNIGPEKKTAKIHEIKDSTVILDFNHPLNGKAVTFSVKILEIEMPEEEPVPETPPPEETSDDLAELEIPDEMAASETDDGDDSLPVSEEAAPVEDGDTEPEETSDDLAGLEIPDEMVVEETADDSFGENISDLIDSVNDSTGEVTDESDAPKDEIKEDPISGDDMDMLLTDAPVEGDTSEQQIIEKTGDDSYDDTLSEMLASDDESLINSLEKRPEEPDDKPLTDELTEDEPFKQEIIEDTQPLEQTEDGSSEETTSEIIDADDKPLTEETAETDFSELLSDETPLAEDEPFKQEIIEDTPVEETADDSSNETTSEIIDADDKPLTEETAETDFSELLPDEAPLTEDEPFKQEIIEDTPLEDKPLEQTPDNSSDETTSEIIDAEDEPLTEETAETDFPELLSDETPLTEDEPFKQEIIEDTPLEQTEDDSSNETISEIIDADDKPLTEETAETDFSELLSDETPLAEDEPFKQEIIEDTPLEQTADDSSDETISEIIDADDKPLTEETAETDFSELLSDETPLTEDEPFKQEIIEDTPVEQMKNDSSDETISEIIESDDEPLTEETAETDFSELLSDETPLAEDEPFKQEIIEDTPVEETADDSSDETISEIIDADDKPLTEELAETDFPELLSDETPLAEDEPFKQEIIEDTPVEETADDSSNETISEITESDDEPVTEDTHSFVEVSEEPSIDISMDELTAADFTEEISSGRETGTSDTGLPEHDEPDETDIIKTISAEENASIDESPVDLHPEIENSDKTIDEELVQTTWDDVPEETKMPEIRPFVDGREETPLPDEVISKNVTEWQDVADEETAKKETEKEEIVKTETIETENVEEPPSTLVTQYRNERHIPTKPKVNALSTIKALQEQLANLESKRNITSNIKKEIPDKEKLSEKLPEKLDLKPEPKITIPTVKKKPPEKETFKAPPEKNSSLNKKNLIKKDVAALSLEPIIAATNLADTTVSTIIDKKEEKEKEKKVEDRKAKVKASIMELNETLKNLERGSNLKEEFKNI